MLSLIRRYLRWLHLRWPAGLVEKLPVVGENGATAVPGLFVVGDLAGVPLLKFSADSGARAVAAIAEDPAFLGEKSREGVLDLLILGGGVSGHAAAMEAKKRGLSFALLEAAEPFRTVADFPKGKPIFTYPTDMVPAGDMRFRAEVKEELLRELQDQAREAGIEVERARAEFVRRKDGYLEVVMGEGPPRRARRVIVAIGRSGEYRRLGVPGERLEKVRNRLHDPKDYAGMDVLVVGGGDSAVEAAIALDEAGGRVALSYRNKELTRPKPENVERLLASGVDLRLGTEVRAIGEDHVELTDGEGGTVRLPNQAVFSMIGRRAPLEFFRKSGVPIRGEWRLRSKVALFVILLAAFFVYHWKKGGMPFGIQEMFAARGWFPFSIPQWWSSLGSSFSDPATIAGTLKASIGEPGFYYSLAYCIAVVLFGIRRMKRRRTPYVRAQTWTLIAVQVVPLFLLPYIVLPWLGNLGFFDDGVPRAFADWFFPVSGDSREYWRSFGFVLAWPLFFWNVFTEQPLWGWLALSFLQTFVLIPWLVHRFGKGAYCGWICSCGALAETMGDAHRQKMPHGPAANRLNAVGQVFLALALLLLVLRSLSWAFPGSFLNDSFELLLHGVPFLNYVWFVDLLWAGILGVGLYWHFSGRVWCRFACPLAALMHIYARFSRFRIFAEKKKCISCNVCTSVCHMGIDVMGFANKGRPMEDPECVRCSACVQSCPTGVLSFGALGRPGSEPRLDRLSASPVRAREAGRTGS
ncbi:MAG: NAD(P)-binding domain-containing protein [Planctomycetota bacterium]